MKKKRQRSNAIDVLLDTHVMLAHAQTAKRRKGMPRRSRRRRANTPLVD
jgi:hypothetical protein